MDNAKSRAAKIADNASRYRRFLLEMHNLETSWEMFQKETEGNLEIEWIAEALKRRAESFDFMKIQITADAKKWAMKMKKDQLLLEEAVGQVSGEFDQWDFWMFEGCGIEWIAECYWKRYEYDSEDISDEDEDIDEGSSDDYDCVEGEEDTRWIFGNDEYMD